MEPCCQDESNRTEPEVPEGAPEGVTMTRCKTCNRRHFVLEVDPAKLGVTMRSI